MFIAGAAVQWLRDGLGVIAQAAETQALAESVPDTGGVYLVPAFVGLGAPYWDPVRAGHARRAHARHRAAPTWPGPRSRPSRTRAATCSTP